MKTLSDMILATQFPDSGPRKLSKRTLGADLIGCVLYWGPEKKP
jgi:hypothetical protein